MNTHQQRLPQVAKRTPNTHPLLACAPRLLPLAVASAGRAMILAGFEAGWRRLRRTQSPALVLCKLVATVGWVLGCWIWLAAPAWAAIRLTELYPAPQSGESEWVELFNDSPTDSVTLTGWWLQDQVSTPSVITTLSDLVLEPLSYVQVSWPTSKLNNTGDEVVLYDDSNTEQDRASFSSSVTGQSWGLVDVSGQLSWQLQSPTPGAANAPASPAPSPSTTPTPSGQASPSPTTTSSPSPSATPTSSASPCPTPMGSPSPIPTTTPLPTPSPSASPAPTSQPSPSPSPSTAPQSTAQLGNITITAVMACPDDTEQEWVEIYNTSSQQLSLAGWYIKDAANNKRNLSGSISSHQFLTIQFSSSFINNSAETLYLYTATNQLAQTINLPSCDGKGVAFINSPEGWIAQDQLPSGTATPTTSTTASSTNTNQSQIKSGAILGAATSLPTTLGELSDAAKNGLSTTIANNSAKLRELFQNQQLQLDLPKRATNAITSTLTKTKQNSNPVAAWLILTGGSLLTSSNGFRLYWRLAKKTK